MLEPFTLEGTFVRLEPLTEEHIPGLVEAAAEDRTNFQWTYTPDGLEQMTDFVRDALRQGGVGRPRPLRHDPPRAAGPTDPTWWSAPPASAKSPSGSGRPVRATNATACPTSSTSASPGWPDSAQRTVVNTEAKLLMMTHAFEVWKVHRVALQTDVRNKRSWAAIERIGGQLDGIMRADRPGADDTVRTSARFSIVAAEWPDVKARLTAATRRRGVRAAPHASEGAAGSARRLRARHGVAPAVPK